MTAPTPTTDRPPFIASLPLQQCHVTPALHAGDDISVNIDHKPRIKTALVFSLWPALACPGILPASGFANAGRSRL